MTQHAQKPIMSEAMRIAWLRGNLPTLLSDDPQLLSEMDTWLDDLSCDADNDTGTLRLLEEEL